MALSAFDVEDYRISKADDRRRTAAAAGVTAGGAAVTAGGYAGAARDKKNAARSTQRARNTQAFARGLDRGGKHGLSSLASMHARMHREEATRLLGRGKKLTHVGRAGAAITLAGAAGLGGSVAADRFSKADSKAGEGAAAGGVAGTALGIPAYRKGRRSSKMSDTLRQQGKNLPLSETAKAPGYARHADAAAAKARKLYRVGGKRAAIGAGIGAVGLGAGGALLGRNRNS